MDRDQFFRKLRRRIRSLPPDEVERVVAYYGEMVADKVESGWTEREAVAGLGGVDALAQKILEENPNRRPRNPGRAVAVVAVSLCGILLIVLAVGAIWTWAAVGTAKDGAPLFAGWGRASAHETKTYTAGAEGIGSVRIRAEYKRVQVEAADSDKIEVEYETNGDQTYDFSSGGGVFNLKNEDRGVRGWLGTKDDAPRVTVRLPEGYAGGLSVDNLGYTEIAGLRSLGEVECNSDNAAIRIVDCSAQSVRIETHNAAIDLDGLAAGRVSADTTNAAIRIRSLDSPDVTLDTTNGLIAGSVRGAEEAYTVRSQTTNAVSNLSDRDGGDRKLTIRTTNALIHVEFEE